MMRRIGGTTLTLSVPRSPSSSSAASPYSSWNSGRIVFIVVFFFMKLTDMDKKSLTLKRKSRGLGANDEEKDEEDKEDEEIHVNPDPTDRGPYTKAEFLNITGTRTVLTCGRGLHVRHRATPPWPLVIRWRMMRMKCRSKCIH